MTKTTDMENRMRAVLHRTFEWLARADRTARFLNRDRRGRPHWASLRRLLLDGLLERGDDEEAARRFLQIPQAEQDRLLGFYERASHP